MDECCFDVNKWNEFIKQPDWYFSINPEWKELGALKDTDKEAHVKCKEKAYDFFEENLVSGNISLAKCGKNWDEDRKPLDTVVIHHTGQKPRLNTNRLSAVTLIRLYASYYTNPYDDKDSNIKGKPIWSNHIRDGKQVFWPYHWIVRTDGTVERLLNDNEIGWQAGNWDTNCRSIAIVLDNNYENSEPSKKELEAIANIIKNNYGYIEKGNIIGHREVNRNTKLSKTTTCPSNLFLPIEDSGWKAELLILI